VGFTVAEIRRLVRGSRSAKEGWRALAEIKLSEIDAHIERARNTRRLLQAVLECGCDDPGGCQMASDALGRRLIQLGTAPA
jgi:hypothetical protein